MRAFGRISALAAVTVLLAVSSRAATIYNFTSFDGPGNNGGGTTANGIDNNGDVVGFSSDNAATPTLFTNFIRNPDGTFATLQLGGDPLAMANGINDANNVVGGLSNGTAFLLSGGSLQPLAAVNGTTTSRTAFGLNNNGQIVGQYNDSNTGTTPGYVLQNGTYTTLNPAVNAAVTNAQAINNNCLVTGFYSADGVHQHGFFYDTATNTFTLATDPNILDLLLVQFLGINDFGMVAGYYQLPDGSQHGLLYNSKTATYTFLDDPNAATSGLSITQITGINDSGELTGFYVDAQTGLQRGFVATAATPEPATFGLLFGSLLAIAAGKRIRRAQR